MRKSFKNTLTVIVPVLAPKIFNTLLDWKSTVVMVVDRQSHHCQTVQASAVLRSGKIHGVVRSM